MAVLGFLMPGPGADGKAGLHFWELHNARDMVVYFGRTSVLSMPHPAQFAICAQRVVCGTPHEKTELVWGLPRHLTEN